MLIENEPLIRLASFAGVFGAVALLELWVPRRQADYTRMQRWPHNLGIVLFNTILLRLLFPVAAMGIAIAAEQKQLGLLNALDPPFLINVIVAILVLDLAIYTQHVVFHRVPLLWRLHRMHHTDTDFDVTTALRFHPLEIVLSMIIKMAIVFLMGAPAVSVLLFEILLNGTAMFNHGNITLPQQFDKWLRRVIVTPDMHRVHHSVEPQETNSNYGFNLSWWDRLFGTYRSQPQAGHMAMTIGLPVFRDRAEQRLDYLITQPFRGTSVAGQR